MQTMTIKELAEVAGCNEKTIRRIGKELYPKLFSRGRKALLDQEQSKQIMTLLPKRNMVGQMSELDRTNVRTNERLDRIEKSLDRLTQILTQVVAHQIEEKKNQIALPPVNYRSELNSIIRTYAQKSGIFFGFAWTEFYTRCLYRLNINPRVRAENAGLDVMDWAEQNGYIEQMYLLAKEEFSV